LLAKATGVCGKKFDKLVDNQRDSKKLWQKVLRLKAVLLAQIMALEAEIKNARQNKTKFTAKNNPKLFEHFEKIEKAKITEHNEAVDKLVSQLAELQTECFDDKSKEHAGIQAEIDRLKGRKLQFTLLIASKSKKLPTKIKTQLEYDLSRYNFKSKEHPQAGNFELQWWMYTPLLLLLPAAALAW
jgi:hypothetical protein